MAERAPVVGVIMGSASDWPTMRKASEMLDRFEVPHERFDSLLSIAQMPGGVPVATMAIGEAGATNAGLFAVALLAVRRPDLRERLDAFRARREREVREQTLGC